MVRLTVAAFLAGLLQFIWGFVFWTVLPLSQDMMGKMNDQDKVAQVIKDTNPETGVYFLPFPDADVMSGANKEAAEAFSKRHSEGPLIQVIYSKDGCPPMDPKLFATGYVHMVASSFLAGLLLLMAGPGLRTYFARLLFVTTLGVFAAFALNLAQPIWFHHPWKFHLLHSVFDVGSYALAGLVLAGLVRRAD